MYKVFIKNKVILFAKSIENMACKEVDFLQLSYSNDVDFIEIVNLLIKDDKLHKVVFLCDKLEEDFNHFINSFTIIDAAGGVVKNSNDEYLFIYRLDNWDLPKGKIEEGEEIKEAAMREVEEECAVAGLKIEKELPNSYHIYHINEEPVIKRTYWFGMTTNYNGELIPQTEEGIEQVCWMNKIEIEEKALNKTYASIQDFLAKVFHS